MKTKLQLCVSSFVLVALGVAFNATLTPAAAQGTAITYQGRLFDGTNPITGDFDLRFHVYSAATGGSILGGPITNAPVPVTNGLFTVLIDFGAGVFTGSSNWLQVGVRTNGSTGAYTALSPRQQLTPTPYAIFAETANSAGLSGTIPDSSLGPDVALLDATQTFTGANSFSGDISLLDPTKTIIFPATSGANSPMMAMFSSGTVNADRMVIAHSLYYPNWGLQYQDSIDQFNFLSSGTPVLSVGLGYDQVYMTGNGVGIGTTSPQQSLSVFAGLNVDQANYNNGNLNNGNTNGYGITFGSASGEGIASKRTAGGNQYGLDFYTSFADRMSLNNAGNLQLNGNDLYFLNGNPNYGIGYRSTEAGLTPSGGFGVFVYGYDVGYLGTVSPDEVSLWWDYTGNVWVSNNLSTASLTVRGDYLVVNGGTPVYAYIGDDGYGNDVQIGSQKSGVTALACYNTADNAYMHVYCSSITIEGGADLAEPFQLTAEKGAVRPGAVVVIDEQNPGQLKLSEQSYDTHVAGVVSGANGISPGIQMQQQGVLAGGKNVALTGRVYVQADTSNGAIKPGDLLTTSSVPGHAMKVTDHARAVGAILGKAMSGLSEGEGMVLVLVTLQ